MQDAKVKMAEPVVGTGPKSGDGNYWRGSGLRMGNSTEL
jgi:hypothetical protein